VNRRLFISALLFVAASALAAADRSMAGVADASQDAVLVPIVPSQLRDSQGFTWASAIVARNFSAAEVPIQCSEPECPRARAGSEFYRSGPLMNAERPSLLFIPADRRGDLALTESISAESLAVVQFQSHELRIPLVRLGDLTAHRLTFLDVRASTYHDRTTLRVYSPLGGAAAGSFTLRVYYRNDGSAGGDRLAFAQSYPFSTMTSNGVTLGYARIGWPAALEDDAARVLPLRVEVESDTPLWGFVTSTENRAVFDNDALNSAPAVSVLLPAEMP